jgi:hypothetical protein
MPSSGILRRVALVRTDVSEELSASSIRVTRIGELGTTLALTRNRRGVCAHGVTSQKTLFFTLYVFRSHQISLPDPAQADGNLTV